MNVRASRSHTATAHGERCGDLSQSEKRKSKTKRVRRSLRTPPPSPRDDSSSGLASRCALGPRSASGGADCRRLASPRRANRACRHRASSFVGVSGFNQLEGLPEPLARHKGGPERRAPVCRRTEVRGVVEESALVAVFAASVSKVATRPCPIPRPARAAGALREAETAAGGDAGVRLGRDSGRGLGGQARDMAREHISHGVCTRGEDGGARLLLLHEATHEPLG